MIYVYKNGKRIKMGDLPLYVYLDSGNNVVADSFDKIKGYDKTIEVDGHLYGQIVAESENRDYFHRLKEGASGKVLEDYQKIYNMVILKEQKNAQIDKRTEEIIYYGYTFDGHLFDTSAESQRDWLGLYSLRNEIPYPFAVTTKDEKEYYFKDADTYASFFKYGTAFINGVVASGRAIKLMIMACATKAEIDAIVDSR